MVYAKDTPLKYGRISEEEKHYIVTTLSTEINLHDHDAFHFPCMTVVTSLPFLAILICNFVSEWGRFTFENSIPSYMLDVLDIDLRSSTLFTMMPYVGVWICVIMSGIWSDQLRGRGVMRTVVARKIMQFIGSFVPAAMIVGLGFLDCTKWKAAVSMLIIAVSFCGFQYNGFLVNHLDIAPQYAGILMGIANTFATVAQFTAPHLQDVITAERTKEQWQTVFFISASFYAFGGLSFLMCGAGVLQEWARVATAGDYENPNSTLKRSPVSCLPFSGDATISILDTSTLLHKANAQKKLSTIEIESPVLLPRNHSSESRYPLETAAELAYELYYPLTRNTTQVRAPNESGLSNRQTSGRKHRTSIDQDLYRASQQKSLPHKSKTYSDLEAYAALQQYGTIPPRKTKRERPSSDIGYSTLDRYRTLPQRGNKRGRPSSDLDRYSDLDKYSTLPDRPHRKGRHFSDTESYSTAQKSSADKRRSRATPTEDYYRPLRQQSDPERHPVNPDSYKVSRKQTNPRKHSPADLDSSSQPGLRKTSVPAKSKANPSTLKKQLSSPTGSLQNKQLPGGAQAKQYLSPDTASKHDALERKSSHESRDSKASRSSSKSSKNGGKGSKRTSRTISSELSSGASWEGDRHHFEALDDMDMEESKV